MTGHTLASGHAFPSTGLLWSVAQLRERYAFLRRLNEPVRFDLLYYPYWVLMLTGTLRWRFFADSSAHQLMIVDGLTGKPFRISSIPESSMECLHWNEAVTAPFMTAQLEGHEGAVSVHCTPCTVSESEAQSLGETFALKHWMRRYTLPFGMTASITLAECCTRLLYKPFWLMASLEHNAGTGQRKVFVFDATTGLGGVSEFWNIVEYALPLYDPQTTPTTLPLAPSSAAPLFGC